MGARSRASGPARRAWGSSCDLQTRRMIATGLDRLLQHHEELAGRRYGLLSHAAAVTADLEPAHLALARSPLGPPQALLAPEHGFYGVEQDMVSSSDEADPWTGCPIVSLYGESSESLSPRPEVFQGLDLLLIDLQDVGTRYYTYAATAVWSAEAALLAGCEVWVLDRPNPLGGVKVEGNLPEAGYESFVGAFHLPVRHGLTLGELVFLEARRRGWERQRLHIHTLRGWRRDMTWSETGRPWLAPSPNLPTLEAALLYPGACLVEGTELSEGRGTTRPFQLLGAPHLHPLDLVRRLDVAELAGVRFVPRYFRPQFQKHAGQVCGGVEVVVTDRDALEPYRMGVEILAAAHDVAPDRFRWRRKPYEFVTDRPAIDLLTRTDRCRRGVEGDGSLEEWRDSWVADEALFHQERSEVLLYPRQDT